MTLKFADMGKNQVRYRLLVEGKNDQHIIWNLAQRLGLKETFEVVAKDSYSEIITVLPTELKSTNTLERLGVIVDADVNIDGHWQAIRNILLKSGFYEVPECLPKEGLVCQPIDPEQLVFGVCIMPNNHLKGMVEDFIIQMIPDTDNDRLLKKADAVLQELEDNNWNLYKAVHHSKARIHTWLSWHDEPGLPMGTAITNQVLSTDNDLCKMFVGWLKRMFDC